MEDQNKLPINTNRSVYWHLRDYVLDRLGLALFLISEELNDAIEGKKQAYRHKATFNAIEMVSDLRSELMAYQKVKSGNHSEWDERKLRESLGYAITEHEKNRAKE